VRHLDLINKMGRGPWQLTFGFGRALRHPALTVWAGRPENVDAAQQALLHRARLAALARSGRYDPALEDSAPQPSAPSP
jgi:fructose-bisphosphate aldolase class I